MLRNCSLALATVCLTVALITTGCLPEPDCSQTATCPSPEPPPDASITTDASTSDASITSDSSSREASTTPPARCVPGEACIPSNPCHEGQVVCSDGGVSACSDKQTVRANGTACDEGSVCHDGVCAACADGTSCTLTNSPCRSGTVDCSTGSAQCMASDNRPNGAACGSGLVCQEGECLACSTGQPCTPANPCHIGTLDCSSAAASCTDRAISVAVGTSCGKD